MTGRIYLVVKGGLGNQLYQAAFGIVLQKLTGKPIYYLTDSFQNYSYGHQFLLDKYFPNVDGQVSNLASVPAGAIAVHEPTTQFDPSIVLSQIIEIIKNHQIVVLDGYWNRGEYLQGHEDEIRSGLNLELGSEELRAQGNVLNSQSYVGIHVRRAEYGHHGIAAMDYYRNSLKQIRREKGNIPAVIFTDEYNVCAYEFKTIPGVTVLKGDTKVPLNDFYLLSRCRHFILSNSTFSYWAAFLGETENSIVYYPYPMCVFAPWEALPETLANRWRVIDGAVRKP